MKRGEKIRKFLKHPGVWLPAFYAALAASVAATVCIMLLWNPANPVAYFFYALSAALLIYCIYASVGPLKRLFGRAVSSNGITSRLAEDFGYRTMVFSGISLGINAAYAVLQGVLGIIYRSPWYGMFAVYYIILSLLRGGALWMNLRAERGLAAAKQRAKLRIYLGCGSMFIVLSVALGTAAGYMIITDTSFRYAGLTIFVMAAYAFYKITLSVINLVKARHYNDYGVQAFRNINLTDALVSIFALQTALIAAFGGEGQSSMRPMNIATGAVIFALTLGIGIYMIVHAAVSLKAAAAEVPPKNSAGEVRADE